MVAFQLKKNHMHSNTFCMGKNFKIELVCVKNPSNVKPITGISLLGESERLKDNGRFDVSDIHSLTLHSSGVIFRWWRPQRSCLEQKLLLQHY